VDKLGRPHQQLAPDSAEAISTMDTIRSHRQGAAVGWSARLHPLLRAWAARAARVFRASVATTGAALAIAQLPTAGADPRQPPPQFPDINAYPAVNLADYQHFGGHPSSSGWLFKAPNGVTCSVGLIDEMGATCWGAAVGSPPKSELNASSLHAGRYQAADPDWNPEAALLPVGTRLDSTNGVGCALLSHDSLACRAAPNKGIDVNNPENSRYGVHGFVLQPSGNWTF
jgi:hypothetical protein